MPHRPPLDRLAFAISAASSPFLVTGVTVAAVILLLRPSLPELILWSSLAVTFAAILPFLFVAFLWRRGKLTDLHVAVREQRTVPFLATLISGAAGVFFLYLAGAPAPLVALGLAYLANGLALTLISLRWKISVHTCVLMTGLLAIALLGYTPALYATPLAPLVMWARVYRRKHTVAQGLAPILLTAAITPLTYFAALRMLGALAP